jgi:hypothetical protein
MEPEPAIDAANSDRVAVVLEEAATVIRTSWVAQEPARGVARRLRHGSFGLRDRGFS